MCSQKRDPDSKLVTVYFDESGVATVRMPKDVDTIRWAHYENGKGERKLYFRAGTWWSGNNEMVERKVFLRDARTVGGTSEGMTYISPIESTDLGVMIFIEGTYTVTDKLFS